MITLDREYCRAVSIIGIVLEQEPEAKLSRTKLLILPQKSKTIGKLLSYVPFQPCFVGVGSRVLRQLDSGING